MKLYDCNVVTQTDKSGRPLHTVVKRGITELEVTMLKAIHTHENVMPGAPVGEIERDPRQEMLSLARKYGDQGGIYSNTGVTLAKKAFGVELHEYDEYCAEQDQLNEEQREERQRQKDAAFAAEMASRPPVAPVVQQPVAQVVPAMTSLDVAMAASNTGKKVLATAELE